jgi:hypothetical protein
MCVGVGVGVCGRDPNPHPRLLRLPSSFSLLVTHLFIFLIRATHTDPGRHLWSIIRPLFLLTHPYLYTHMHDTHRPPGHEGLGLLRPQGQSRQVRAAVLLYI